MKITYFHRNPSAGYSIGKVSRTYISEIEKTEEVENVYMPCAKADPLSVIRNMWYAFKHRNKDGINHITGDVHYLALVLPGKKTVITFHDIGFYFITHGLKRLILLAFWFYIPIRKAGKIVCISDTTRERLSNITGFEKEKILLIHNAIDPLYRYSYKNFNTNKPSILCVGTSNSKNLERTIMALKDINCHLRIIGKLNEKILCLLNEQDIEYSNVYDLSDECVYNEYKKCDLVSFASTHEGFGMPIIEGQSVGRVVITSNISPCREVAGDGAFLVNPFDVESIRNGFCEVISNSKLRDDIIENGLKNVAKYTSVTVSNQYHCLYSSIINNK